jgi:hypothetical protein
MKPLNQIKPNLAVMVPVLVPFKLMFDSHALYPRWPPLLKIEMPSNGQNCFILRQWFLTRRFLNDFFAYL